MKPAFLLLLAPTLALTLPGCSRHDKSVSTAQAALPPAKVQLATVRTENLPDVIEVSGTIRPAQRAQLAAKVMGSIDEMPVALGQRVKSGDVIAKINAAEISARVAQAQSQLNAARRDLDRERALLTKGASTADMVRGLEDRFAAAEAMVREAEAMLSYTTIRAPFDGVIARKLANAGDLAAPGYPLVELEGAGDFQVEAGVPASLAAQLEPGRELSVSVPGTSANFTGKVAELSSAADPNAHTVLAKITVPEGTKVHSGAFARVQIPGAAVPSLVVPASAVSRSGQMERVFVAIEGAPGGAATPSRASPPHAGLRLVKTGAERNDKIEILAGLDANERVVVSPPASLREGQPLEVVR